MGGTFSSEMKAGLTMLQEMYAQGTIAKEFITNEIRVKWFTKTVQAITYLPCFLS